MVLETVQNLISSATKYRQYIFSKNVARYKDNMTERKRRMIIKLAIEVKDFD